MSQPTAPDGSSAPGAPGPPPASGALLRLRSGALRTAHRASAATPLIVKVGGPVLAVSLGMALYLEGALDTEECGGTPACTELSQQVSLVTTDGTALLLVVLWLVFMAFVGRRTKRLAEVARRVAEGDLTARVGGVVDAPAPVRPARDELMLVAGQFDRMIDTLVEEQQRLRGLTEELEHRATHDDVTGLGNRHLLLRHLEKALGAPRSTPLAVVKVELDDLATIDATLGHDVGELVVTTTALRLSAAVRGDERVVRASGSVFAVLVEDVPDDADAAAIALRLLEVVNQPVEVEGATVVLSACAGAVLHRPGEQRSPEDVLRDASLALHAAQRTGADNGSAARTVLYTPCLREEVLERSRTADELRAALAGQPSAGDLLVHYQPYALLADPSRVAGFEALVRWQHPARGLVSPLDFVPVAEEVGLIRPIGLKVLQDAAERSAAWHALDPARPWTTSVNLSPQQLLDVDLVHRVRDVLDRTGLAPQLLTLELTETAMMLDLDGAARRLQALRDLGVGIAIDDFGTGSSSLSYLHQLPVDVVKLDRAFISRLEDDTTSLAMVRAVLDIASALGLTTIAEGIETPGQLRILGELGCDKAQGFLLSRPVPQDVAQDLLTGVRPLGAPAAAPAAGAAVRPR
ncbi:GGDEF domain-containing protein [Streptomyces sp. NP160]|uniref:putative bifunctional diguanylate cyclase/phosphodiesterase n=1 Tax=Streptomyces sp. NP160 TaxID=2586637 RepID=UPI00111B5D90|nr:GGDEF domain-containing protein [Streptomyces sp. NP160]TNM69360.1 GGDEF domain-containing protein [Streptomyces sp. NP160]